MLLGALDSKPNTVIANGEDITSSEDKKEDQTRNVNVMHPVTEFVTPSYYYKDHTNSELLNGQMNNQLHNSVNGSHSYHSDEDGDGNGGENDNVHDVLGAGDSSIPTIYFAYTVEPKRV